MYVIAAATTRRAVAGQQRETDARACSRRRVGSEQRAGEDERWGHKSYTRAGGSSIRAPRGMIFSNLVWVWVGVEWDEREAGER